MNQQGAAEEKARSTWTAKVRRQIFNEAGEVKVDPSIHEMWLKKGADRDKLIDTMIEVNGNKASCQHM